MDGADGKDGMDGKDGLQATFDPFPCTTQGRYVRVVTDVSVLDNGIGKFIVSPRTELICVLR